MQAVQSRLQKMVYIAASNSKTLVVLAVSAYANYGVVLLKSR